MTNEEKAEVYATEQMKSYLCLDDYSYGVLKLKITEAYFDGLAEGRKENEKENAELKEIVSRSGYRIAELKHEIDELKSELSDIKTAIRNYSKAETYQQQEITWNSLLEFIN